MKGAVYFKLPTSSSSSLDNQSIRSNSTFSCLLRSLGKLLLLLVLVILVIRLVQDKNEIIISKKHDSIEFEPNFDPKISRTWNEKQPGNKGKGSFNSSALRFFQRGVPLVDRWKSNLWPLSNEAEVFDVIGNPFLKLRCTRESEQKQVRMAFSPYGFGSNMIVFADSVIYSFQENKRFIFVSRRNQRTFNTCDGCYNKWNPFSLQYELLFSFSVPHDTTCLDFEAICGGLAGYCVGITKDGTAGKVLTRLLKREPEFFLGARVELIRMFTRLKLPTRKAVDKINEGINFSSTDGYTVGIHLRRGDKAAEATPVEEAHYMKAVIEAITNLEKRKDKMYIQFVVIGTDSSQAAGKFMKIWKEQKQIYQPRKGFIVRNSVEGVEGRPDFIRERNKNSTNYLYHQTLNLLADLSCLIQTDIFVGTKSSNFGEVVCYLRGGNQCFDAENFMEKYQWNHLQDKLT